MDIVAFEKARPLLLETWGFGDARAYAMMMGKHLNMADRLVHFRGCSPRVRSFGSQHVKVSRSKRKEMDKKMLLDLPDSI